MAKEVSFSIKVDDKGTVKRVTADAAELGRVVRSVQDEADKLKRDVLTWSEAAQAVDVLQNTVSQLYSVMTDLTAASQVQLVAETQLETIMRQRMSATDDEVASIKELASAQQQLGVIGDEVQLSGAQQMATFLNEKQSIDTLLPAMNNLLAQQNGLNATTQDAVSIGNMMGKAMQGQVDVLQRVGITFDEDQKKVLQYGDESERAAMLAEVITQNVGNMNAKLAETDAGKQKQLENELGDIKEVLGSIVQGAMPFMTMASQITLCAVGAVKLITTIKALGAAFSLTALKAKALSAGTSLASVAMRLMGVQATATGFAIRGTNIALSGTAVALRGVMLATGVGAVITALAMAFDALTSSLSKTTESVKEFDEAQQAYTETSGRVKAELDGEVKKLKSLIDAKKDTTEEVKHLNKEYGTVFGNHKTAAEWYDVLIQKSKDYAMQLGYEAQAKLIASKIAQNQMQLEDDYDKRKQMWKDGKARVQTTKVVGGGNSGYTQSVTYQEDSQEYKAIKQQDAKLIAENKQLQQQLDRATGKAVSYATKVGTALPTTTNKDGGTTTPKSGGGTTTTSKEVQALEGSIDYLENRISTLRKQITATPDRELAKQLTVEMQSAEAALKDRKIEVGLEVSTDPKPLEGSIDYLENRLSSLRKQITATPDTELAKKLQQEIEEAEAQLKNKRIEVGLEHPEIVASVPSIQAKTDSTVYEEKSYEDKRASHTNAEQNAAIIQQNYEIGLINKDEALDGLAEINKKLEELGLNPVHIDVETEDVDKAAKKMQAATDSVGQMGQSLSSLGSAIEVPAFDVAGTLAQAIATMTAGYATATSQAASMGPWAWVAFAATGLAQLAAMVSSVKGMAKFADGGIVYGPTVGLMGEYSGASSNPEVIAPLNKLKSLIGNAGGAVEVHVTGRMRGTDMVLMGDNVRQINRRYR